MTLNHSKVVTAHKKQHKSHRKICLYTDFELVEKSITTLLRTCNTNRFGYPLKVTKTC